MRITGEIKKINEPKKISNELSKLDVHLMSDYNNNVISVQFFGKRISLIEGYKVGDKIEVHVEITGREHNDKVFNTLNVKQIKLINN